MSAFRAAHAPANKLPPDVVAELDEFIMGRTRADPEKMCRKAIDPTMSSNQGMFKGFHRLAGDKRLRSETTFRRWRQAVLRARGYSDQVVRCRHRHQS